MSRSKESEAQQSGFVRWLATLDELDVRYLVLNLQDDRDLVRLLLSQREWVIDFRDGKQVLLGRAPKHVNASVAA